MRFMLQIQQLFPQLPLKTLSDTISYPSSYLIQFLTPCWSKSCNVFVTYLQGNKMYLNYLQHVEVRKSKQMWSSQINVTLYRVSGWGKHCATASSLTLINSQTVHILTLYSPVVTICITSLTFTNSTFCPRSVFMCFVWIWEQTAIISLYSINWLVL